MAEMISKWAVVNKLIALENEFQQYKPFEGFEHAMYRKVCELEMEIGKAPGMEVVRCKDCRFWVECDSSLIGKVMCCTGQGDVKIHKTAEGYCSCGERKDNEVN